MEFEKQDATITILFDEYHSLKKSKDKLECLENAGVDNWVGYSYACDAHKQNYPEEN